MNHHLKILYFYSDRQRTMNVSSMDLHLPLDRDYSRLGGLITLSTQDPADHRLFMDYLAANPRSPMRMDIPDRDWYRGEFHYKVILKFLARKNPI